MRLREIILVWVALCLASGLATSHATVIYVDQTAPGHDDGSSWTNAYLELRVALQAATAGDTLWVAAGTYRPTALADPTISFELIDGVAVYGGFDGSENALSQRDIEANPTILSGSIPGSNSYHVVRANTGVTAAAVLDGFTISDGASASVGGGAYFNGGRPRLENLTFSNNSAAIHGGGLYSNVGQTLDNVTFEKNLAQQGGAIYTTGNEVFTVSGGVFIDNVATSHGGAIRAGTTTLDLVNVVLESNSAGGDGGAVYALNSTTLGAFNLTVASNSAAGDGGGIYSDAPTSQFQDIEFTANSAGGLGGGLYTATDFIVRRVKFSNNTASTGGGLFATGFVQIANSLFEDNQAQTGGGASVTKNADILNTTFATNIVTASCGAIEVASPASANITNTIVWSNGANSIGGSGSRTIQYSLIEGSGGSSAWNPSFGTDGGNNIDVDPLFINQATEDFHLQLESLAINGGLMVSGGGTADLDGNPRTALGDTDMGCYELQVACPTGSAYFVDSGAVSNQLGVSWGSAFNDLQDALAAIGACPGVDEIWVAAGVYLPTSGSDRTSTFQLQNDVSIYGGFGATEASLEERDFAANITRLSGSIGAATNADNSYHVVTGGSDITATAILDGFTVCDGNASGADPDDDGAGIHNIDGGGPTLRNLVIRDNNADGNGGGMLNLGQVTLSNVVFDTNFAGGVGGGLAEGVTASTLENVTFKKNISGGDGGGYFASSLVNSTLSNAVFWGNVAGGAGGGVYMAFSGSPTFINVSFNNNSSTDPGSALVTNAGSPELYNSILWGHSGTSVVMAGSGSPQYVHCIVEGSGGSGAWDPSYGDDIANNIDADPLFNDSSTGDLHLMPSSPALDAGDMTIPGILPADLDGEARVSGANIDLGPYETQIATDVGEDVSDNAPPEAVRVISVAAAPNPFNPVTMLSYSVPATGPVSLRVFDTRGRVLHTLVDNPQHASGVFRIPFRADAHASGMYMVRLITGNTTRSLKIVALK